ncbi:helix-turn-helix domain-containing protein [Streptomyces sp. NPDC001435]|uniref:helix-turn-helix domain-containing protein n=1 Tax=unclassified Streptomyces TaxID=2593676 RepID=UPI0036CE2E4A
MQAAELFDQEIKPPEVARCLRVSRKSVYQWHQLWRDGGAEALASRGPSGSRCRLSPRCLEKLAVYLDEGPAAHGWVEDQVWTAARVAPARHPRRLHSRDPLAPRRASVTLTSRNQ